MRELEAIRLRENLWAVRPTGAVGTCGWIGGRPWMVQYVRAKDAEEAVKKAKARDNA